MNATARNSQTDTGRPRVLIFVGDYLPGALAGGPIRSIANLVEALGDEIEFRLVTRDREIPDTPYPNITPNQWIRVGKAALLYLTPSRLGFRSMFRILSGESADILYLNSFFSPGFSILPMAARIAGARAQKKVILAPRGEFSPGALLQSPVRKRAFAWLAKRLSAYRQIIWHASTRYEAEDIRAIFGSTSVIRTALDPRALHKRTAPEAPHPTKQPGRLRVVFLGRIVPKKNLLYAIRLVSRLSGTIEFTVVGPHEDYSYWCQCLAELKKLPSHITVSILPGVSHDEVSGIFASHHVFLFPTLGENYGHVICEALEVGCPVILSDQTPWRNLEESGAGFVLPLERPDLYEAALQKYLLMNNAEFSQAAECARDFVERFSAEADAVGASRALFSAQE